MENQKINKKILSKHIKRWIIFGKINGGVRYSEYNIQHGHYSNIGI